MPTNQGTPEDMCAQHATYARNTQYAKWQPTPKFIPKCTICIFYIKGNPHSGTRGASGGPFLWRVTQCQCSSMPTIAPNPVGIISGGDNRVTARAHSMEPNTRARGTETGTMAIRYGKQYDNNFTPKTDWKWIRNCSEIIKKPGLYLEQEQSMTRPLC